MLEFILKSPEDKKYKAYFEESDLILHKFTLTTAAYCKTLSVFSKVPNTISFLEYSGKDYSVESITQVIANAQYFKPEENSAFTDSLVKVYHKDLDSNNSYYLAYVPIKAI